MRILAPILILSVLVPVSGSAASLHRREALIVYGKDQSFNREAFAFARAVSARGYETSKLDVWTLPNHDAVVESLEHATSGLTQGDRLLLTFNCHGGRLRGDVYFDPMKVRGHSMCRVTSGDVNRLADQLHRRGVEVIVFDDSCSGGSTVELLERLDVCAIASVAPGLPSVTGFPAFSRALGDARTFEDVALAGEFQIFHRMPGRVGQKGYYSTRSGLARSEAVLRSAFSYAANSLSDMQLEGSPIYSALRPNARSFRQWKTIEQVLKRSAHYADVLNRALAATLKQWAGASGPATAATYQEAIHAFGRNDLLPEGLPAGIVALHERIRTEVQMALKRRAHLADLIDAWQRGAGNVDEIRRVQAELQKQDADVSILLGVSEYVETKGDASPCRVSI